MASVGERVKKQRIELGLTQHALAKRVGLSQTTISDLENNLTGTTREVVQLAAVLGVSPLWLADGEGQMIPDGTVPVLQTQALEIPPKVLRLAEQLMLLPDEKLIALSVLLGIKF